MEVQLAEIHCVHSLAMHVRGVGGRVMVKDIPATEGRLLDREVLGLQELLVGDAQLCRVAAIPD
jgi:hypothetical protein